MYGVVPPVTVRSIAPFVPPLQFTFVDVAVAASTAGCVTVRDKVEEHPLASVTVTLYVPAATPAISCAVDPFDQLYVNGDVPPETVRSIAPVLLP